MRDFTMGMGMGEIRNHSRIFLGRIHKCNTGLGLIIQDWKGEGRLRGLNGRLLQGMMGLVQSSMRLVQSSPI